jgi:hypothetical protein
LQSQLVWYIIYNTLEGSDSVDTNDIIRESSKERRTISRPGQTRACRDLAILRFFGANGFDDNLGFKIPDLDRVVSGGAEPVSVGGKDESINDLTGVKRVQALALVEVPQHGGVVLSTTGGQGAIGRHTNSVEVSSVSDKVVAKLAVGKVPDLDQAIPSSRDDERHRLRRGESHARNPLSVSFRVARDGVLALSKSVPEANGGITGSCRKMDRKSFCQNQISYNLFLPKWLLSEKSQ